MDNDKTIVCDELYCDNICVGLFTQSLCFTHGNGKTLLDSDVLDDIRAKLLLEESKE